MWQKILINNYTIILALLWKKSNIFKYQKSPTNIEAIQELAYNTTGSVVNNRFIQAPVIQVNKFIRICT